MVGIFNNLTPFPFIFGDFISSKQISLIKTLGNKILVSAHGQVYHDTGSSSTGYTNWYLEGNTNSGIGATTNGCPFRQEFGRYGPADWVFDHLGITVLSGACTTATPTYQLYNEMTNPNGQTVTMVKWYFTAQEIQQ